MFVEILAACFLFAFGVIAGYAQGAIERKSLREALEFADEEEKRLQADVENLEHERRVLVEQLNRERELQRTGVDFRNELFARLSRAIRR